MQISKHEYESKLVNLGCQRLGGGLYSEVYAIPNTDKAIKIGDMDEWPTYIKWAIENGHAGKFAPKVFSLKFHDGFYAAIMERLVCTINDMKHECRNISTQTNVFASFYDDDCEATELVEYISALREARLSSDMHGGNVMVRSDGQMVVTDPISGGFSSERFRIKAGRRL